MPSSAAAAPTASQVERRDAYAAACAEWRGLSAVERQGWALLALEQPVAATGFNLLTAPEPEPEGVDWEPGDIWGVTAGDRLVVNTIHACGEGTYYSGAVVYLWEWRSNSGAAMSIRYTLGPGAAGYYVEWRKIPDNYNPLNPFGSSLAIEDTDSFDLRWNEYGVVLYMATVCPAPDPVGHILTIDEWTYVKT
jgi:hypothetical protein